MLSEKVIPFTKVCSKCKIEKSVKDFYKHPGCKQGIRPDCKICADEYNDSWMKVHGKEHNRKRTLRRYWNLTLEDYDRMLAAQNGGCAICETKVNIENKRFAVDHCHKTNKIRGLLCDLCNRGIGLLREDEEILNKAITYIKKYK